MQHDDAVWNLLSQNFCSFKVKTRTNTFCKHEYNVTGLCSRQACPLANSRYATILEREGRCVMYIKTIERAHMPNRLWEKIKLPSNYTKALEIVDERMQYWPKFLVHKAKQRLTKITQYLIRKRRLKLRAKTRLVGINKKVEKRDRSREAKALRAAKLDRTIEKELLERLRSGTYDSIYNFPKVQYEKALEEEAELEEEEDEEIEEEVKNEAIREIPNVCPALPLSLSWFVHCISQEEEEMEYEAEYDSEEDEEEEEYASSMQDMEDLGSESRNGEKFDFDDDSDLDDEEIAEEEVRKVLTSRSKTRAKGRKRKSRGASVQVEYENEPTTTQQETKGH
mmetsp:Transcript_40806/g.161665  ORF Transcript_40806/g.161665 Transcript_40806/m.161665 type:complete len:338 (-) Transcript_40806:809-1822(-)